MVKVFSAKKATVVVIASCICAALASAPAFAFYYAHDDAHTAAESKGVMEVVCTLDQTAVGGGINTEIVFVAEGATAKDAIAEAVIGNNAANDPAAIKDHSAQSFASYISGKNYTVDVYEAASQKPGTQTTYDAKSLGGESTQLGRFDSVVVTVK